MGRKYRSKNQGIGLCKGRLEAHRKDGNPQDTYQSCWHHRHSSNVEYEVA